MATPVPSTATIGPDVVYGGSRSRPYFDRLAETLVNKFAEPQLLGRLGALLAVDVVASANQVGNGKVRNRRQLTATELLCSFDEPAGTALHPPAPNSGRRA
jgi:hypothetical protein